jgi:hypothetical protein
MFFSKNTKKEQSERINKVVVEELNTSQYSLNNELLCIDTRYSKSNWDLGDSWTIGDACEGVQIFGATGSGKTSGSGATLARSYLENGFGGLILTAKSDEIDNWKKYCDETGRELVVFNTENEWRFNFLDYEMNRDGKGAGRTENIVNLFFTIMEMAEKSKGFSDPYWKLASKQLIRSTIELLKISNKHISLETIYKVITTAPRSAEEVKQIHLNIISKNDKDTIHTEFALLLHNISTVESSLDEEKKKDLDITLTYWFDEFSNLAEKTRSIIVNGFTSMIDPFLRGDMRKLFCTDLNIVPEMTHEGMIIILDLPIFEYGEVGRYAQIIWKYLWQQSTQRRKANEDDIPSFLWADESQYFINEYDAKFQSVARSAKACTVYLTQNLPNYYEEMKNRDATKGFLGNLRTKIFHSNDDVETNHWASEIISKKFVSRNSTTHTSQSSQSYHETKVLEERIIPIEFSQLKTGGDLNNGIVEGIIYKNGSFARYRFNQNPDLDNTKS